MDPIEQLKQMKESIEKTTMPEMKKMMKSMQEAREFMSPIESKPININGTSCTIQLFKDKVAVLLPSQKMAEEFYTKFSEIREEVEKLVADNGRLKDGYTAMQKTNVRIEHELKSIKEKWYYKLFSKW